MSEEIISNEYLKRKSMKQVLFSIELIENLYEQYTNALPLCLELKKLLENKSLHSPITNEDELRQFNSAHKALYEWVLKNRIKARTLIDACGFDNLGDIMQVGSEAVAGLEVEGDSQQAILDKLL